MQVIILRDDLDEKLSMPCQYKMHGNCRGERTANETWSGWATCECLCHLLRLYLAHPDVSGGQMLP